MPVIVQKYGGTSVADAEHVRNVARRIIKKKEEGNDLVVVVSAMGDTTDRLVRLAHELNPHPAKRELDMLLSTGEQISTSVLSMTLQEMGYDAISLTGSQVGMRTIGMHGRSRIVDIDTYRINEALKEGKIVIVAGFQGVNENDDITTLGRGGSDTSAVALSAALNCPCEIYTDVDGIYGVDPRSYKKAKKLKHVSCDEMLEMASLGAGVMHARAIELGAKYGIEIKVASSLNEKPGTQIVQETEKTVKPVTGLAIDSGEFIVTLKNVRYSPHTSAELFARIGAKGVNIDMISQSPENNGKMDISFSAPLEDEEMIAEVLEDYRRDYFYEEAEFNKGIIKISAVGSGMKHRYGVAAKFFRTLSESKVPVLMITTSMIRISCVIPEKYEKIAVESISEAFDL